MSAPKHSSRSRRRHAQLHLPPLTAEQALLLVSVLERAIRSIYRAHGDAMADLCAARIDPPAQRCFRFYGLQPDDCPF